MGNLLRFCAYKVNDLLLLFHGRLSNTLMAQLFINRDRSSGDFDEDKYNDWRDIKGSEDEILPLWTAKKVRAIILETRSPQ